MRRLLAIAFLLLASVAVHADRANVILTSGSGAPAGSCATIQLYLNTANGNIYGCPAGSWVLVGSLAPTVSTATNCASAAGTCVAAPAGAVTIAAAGTTVTVGTTAVTANSQIFVFEDSSLGTRLSVTCNTTAGRVYAVTARTAGTSFVITASAAPAANPACLNFLVVN